MIISDTFYPSLMYSRNFYIWYPWRQRVELQSPRRFGPYLTIRQNYIRNGPYGYARIRARNFSIKTFRTLRYEGIQFHVCRNPNVECAVVESAQLTIRDRLYKFFTYKNKFRYIDVLPKFVRAYNDTVHSTTGMASSCVTDSQVLAIWKRINRRRIRLAKVKFSVGQHVHISKETM